MKKPKLPARKSGDKLEISRFAGVRSKAYESFSSFPDEKDFKQERRRNPVRKHGVSS